MGPSGPPRSSRPLLDCRTVHTPWGGKVEPGLDPHRPALEGVLVTTGQPQAGRPPSPSVQQGHGRLVLGGLVVGTPARVCPVWPMHLLRATPHEPRGFQAGWEPHPTLSAQGWNPTSLPEGPGSEAQEGWTRGVTPPSAPQAKFLLRRCGCEPRLRNAPGQQASLGAGSGGLGADPASPQLPGPPQSPTHSPPDSWEKRRSGGFLSSRVHRGPSALPQPPCPSWPLASV